MYIILFYFIVTLFQNLLFFELLSFFSLAFFFSRLLLLSPSSSLAVLLLLWSSLLSSRLSSLSSSSAITRVYSPMKPIASLRAWSGSNNIKISDSDNHQIVWITSNNLKHFKMFQIVYDNRRKFKWGTYRRRINWEWRWINCMGAVSYIDISRLELNVRWVYNYLHWHMYECMYEFSLLYCSKNSFSPLCDRQNKQDF